MCFAVLMDSADEWDIRELNSNVRKALSEIEAFVFTDEGVDTEELRSYPSTVLGTIYDTKRFGDVVASVSVVAVIRSGYYEGACFDWLLTFEIDSETTYEDLESIIEAVNWNSDMPVGMQKIQSKNILKFFELKKSQIVAEVEKVFATFVEVKLNKIGSASNGETFYQQSNS